MDFRLHQPSAKRVRGQETLESFRKNAHLVGEFEHFLFHYLGQEKFHFERFPCITTQICQIKR